MVMEGRMSETFTETRRASRRVFRAIKAWLLAIGYSWSITAARKFQAALHKHYLGDR
jgi:hypothetical protein